MFYRLLIAGIACAGVSAFASESLSPGGVRAEEAMPTVWGIPFEAIETRWEGELRDWTLVTEGRLPGTDKVVRYEQRRRLGEQGWESAGLLSLAATHVEDLAPLLANFPKLAGFGGSGTLAFTAGFVQRGQERNWEGRMQLGDVSLRYEELDLQVEGIDGALDWRIENGCFTTAPGQVLSFDSLTWDDVKTERAAFEFEMISATEWRIGPLVLEWAGGLLSAAEVVFDPTNPDVTVRLEAAGISLQEVLKLAPDFDGRGEGLIDGQLGLRVRREGIGLEPGFLGLRAGYPARLQIPQQAWFTGDMSPQAANYEKLRMIERALEDLQLSKFRLDFLSEEAGEGPLKIVLEGRPLVKDVPTPSVGLTLQVHGPVKDLTSWFLKPGVRIGLH